MTSCPEPPTPGLKVSCFHRGGALNVRLLTKEKVHGLGLRDKAALHAIDKIVGQNIRKYRMARGMSQKKLGDDLGVTSQQTQKYENATNRISASRLYALGMVFGLPVEVFFSGLECPGVDIAAGSIPSETVETALKIEALSKQCDVLAQALCEKLGELANSLMREVCRQSAPLTNGGYGPDIRSGSWRTDSGMNVTIEIASKRL